FNIVHSSNGEGQIVITLSTINDHDGYYGVTRTIVNGNQILKAFITTYDTDKLTDTQIGSIIRHEFGYALGLPPTSNAADLMYESISTDHSYISECDINAIQKLYNGEKPSDDFCNNM
ncbi:MAG: matrixin family metalloprotease, partial [Nitrosotalea sp.]